MKEGKRKEILQKNSFLFKEEKKKEKRREGLFYSDFSKFEF